MCRNDCEKVMDRCSSDLRSSNESTGEMHEVSVG
jgi:hypothetical protein